MVPIKISPVFLAVFMAGFLGVIKEAHSIQISTCGDPDAELIKLHKLVVSPDPIPVPGSITVSLEADILQDIVAPIGVNTTMEMLKDNSAIFVPCVLGFGSCYTEDICETLSKMKCPDSLLELGLTCQCPFEQGKVVFSEMTFDLPLGAAAPGSYQITYDIYTNGSFALCLDVALTVELGQIDLELEE